MHSSTPAARPVKHTVLRVTGRVLSGRRLDGQPHTTDATFIHAGTRALTPSGHASRWAMLPGWKRAAWRLGTPAVLTAVGAAYAAAPTMTTVAASSAATVAAGRGVRAVRRRVRTRRLRRIIVRPAARAIAPLVGIPTYIPGEKWLRVAPELAALVPKVNRPMSPAEIWTRERYARWIEPAVMWGPERAMRAWWAASSAAAPYLEWTAVFRRPAPADSGPCIEVRVPGGVVVDDELAARIRKALTAKTGLDLTESWDQIGPEAVGRFRVRERPPSSCSLDDIREYIFAAAEYEIVLGLAAGRKPVVVSLDDDSPHIAVSASSGAGKSVLAMLAAGQVLARGGRVFVLDTKGSHRWAKSCPGVTLCMDVADIHAALLGLDKLSAERNREAFIQDDGFDPGDRVLIIAEELNATMSLLRAYWSDVREPHEPKVSPAVAAYRRILFMGRSAKVNILAIGQMLTGPAAGGPEARECLGIRCMARYTANAWRMLAPEVPMPKRSRTRGRWQIVTAGTATETQVAYLRTADVHELAAVGHGTGPALSTADVPTGPNVRVPAQTTGTGTGTALDGDTPPAASSAALVELAALDDRRPVTLREALDRGILTGDYETVRKRIQRAGADGPPPAGRDGKAHTYRPDDLRTWAGNSLATG